MSSDELFEAVSHPMRIEIIKKLAEKPLCFADLKRYLKIDSSGLLDFHLKKLDDLITINDEGNYTLTDRGFAVLNTAIGKEIARQVNLGSNIMPASSFINKPDSIAQSVIERADGFAQVFPEHKFSIVQSLQKKGHIVGMTGDGVNDAPVLKEADTGIAVAGAIDAAKSVADIVLEKPGISVIIDAIKLSRQIFQRMNNYSIYRITETIRVLLFITLSIIIFQFYPITALMIVLLAIMNDLPIITIAYDNVKYSNKPEK